MKKYLISSLAIILAMAFFLTVSNTPKSAEGSVSLGSEYHATSTQTITANNRVITTGVGTFGAVVITGVTTGTLTVIDGTTTSPGADWANPTLAQFPASVAAGTYEFDIIYRKGLLISWTTGGYATSTITYR